MSGIGPISQTPPPLDFFIGPVDPRYCPVTASSTIDAGAAALSKFQVHRPVTVTKATIFVGLAGGNIDIGIYDEGLNKLGSIGATANTATGEQRFTLLAPVKLVPGVLYYAAFVTDSATAKFVRAAVGGSFMFFYEGLGGYYGASYPLGTLGALASTSSNCWVVVFS